MKHKFGFELGQNVGHIIKKIQTYDSPEEAYILFATIVGFTKKQVVIEFPNGHKKVTYPALLRAHG